MNASVRILLAACEDARYRAVSLSKALRITVEALSVAARQNHSISETAHDALARAAREVQEGREEGSNG